MGTIKSDYHYHITNYHLPVLTLNLSQLVLTGESLLIKLHKVAEDIFGDGFLVRDTLEENHHLGLTYRVHPFGRHVPALPVHVWRITNKE